MICHPRTSLAPLALLLVAGCGDDDGTARADAALADAPLSLPDAPPPDAAAGDAPVADAFISLNAPRLWLAGIGGSETNLQLQPSEPGHF